MGECGPVCVCVCVVVFQAEDGIRDRLVTGVQTCALPIYLILVMSVEPGFGGQGYMDGSTERILNIKQKLKEQCLQDQVLIEVDGGIKLHNAKEVIDAGADVLVAGSAVFGTEDPAKTIQAFYNL